MWYGRKPWLDVRENNDDLGSQWIDGTYDKKSGFSPVHTTDPTADTTPVSLYEGTPPIKGWFIHDTTLYFSRYAYLSRVGTSLSWQWSIPFDHFCLCGENRIVAITCCWVLVALVQHILSSISGFYLFLDYFFPINYLLLPLYSFPFLRKGLLQKKHTSWQKKLYPKRSYPDTKKILILLFYR